MPLVRKEPFVRMHEKKQVDSFAVRLNEDERRLLDACKQILKQKKDSTALKQMALIGAKTLHDKKIMQIVEFVTENKRKNKDRGIVDFD